MAHAPVSRAAQPKVSGQSDRLIRIGTSHSPLSPPTLIPSNKSARSEPPPTRSNLPHTQRKRVRGHTASAAASVAVAVPAGRGTADPVGATPPVSTSCEQGRDTQMSPGRKVVVVSFPHRSLASAYTPQAPTPCRVRTVSRRLRAPGAEASRSASVAPTQQTDRQRMPSLACAPCLAARSCLQSPSRCLESLLCLRPCWLS